MFHTVDAPEPLVDEDIDAERLPARGRWTAPNARYRTTQRHQAIRRDCNAATTKGSKTY